MTRHRAAVRASVLFGVALCGILLSAQSPSQPPRGRLVPPGLAARAQRDGRVRVLVQLRLPGGTHVPEGRLASRAAVTGQRRDIRDAGARVAAALAAADRRIVHRYEPIPLIALEVGAAALSALEASADVDAVFEDAIVRPSLAESVPLIPADQAWAAGYDGTGTTVAVLDTGVDANHPFLAGKVIDEACYSSTI